MIPARSASYKVCPWTTPHTAVPYQVLSIHHCRVKNSSYALLPPCRSAAIRDLMQGMGNALQNAPQSLTTSVKRHCGAIRKIRTPSGRGGGVSLMQNRRLASGGGATKQEKFRSGPSVCLHHDGAPYWLSLSQKHRKQLCIKVESSLEPSP